jgi:hypothetical protein
MGFSRDLSYVPSYILVVLAMLLSCDRKYITPDVPYSSSLPSTFQCEENWSEGRCVCGVCGVCGVCDMCGVCVVNVWCVCVVGVCVCVCVCVVSVWYVCVWCVARACVWCVRACACVQGCRNSLKTWVVDTI